MCQHYMFTVHREVEELNTALTMRQALSYSNIGIL